MKTLQELEQEALIEQLDAATERAINQYDNWCRTEVQRNIVWKVIRQALIDQGEMSEEDIDLYLCLGNYEYRSFSYTNGENIGIVFYIPDHVSISKWFNLKIVDGVITVISSNGRWKVYGHEFETLGKALLYAKEQFSIEVERKVQEKQWYKDQNKQEKIYSRKLKRLTVTREKITIVLPNPFKSFYIRQEEYGNDY